MRHWTSKTEDEFARWVAGGGDTLPCRFVWKWSALGITLLDGNKMEFMGGPLQSQPSEQLPRPTGVWLSWEYSLGGFSLSSAL